MASPTIEAVCSGMFVWQGFFETVGGFNSPNWETVSGNLGHTGVVSELAAYAHIPDAVWCSLPEAQTHELGVYDYEYTEPMGAWVAREVIDRGGIFPTVEEFEHELRGRIAAYVVSEALKP